MYYSTLARRRNGLKCSRVLSCVNVELNTNVDVDPDDGGLGFSRKSRNYSSNVLLIARDHLKHFEVTQNDLTLVEKGNYFSHSYHSRQRH
jgi:hypothetical protein